MAIGFDTTTDYNNTGGAGTGHTWSHTITGSLPFLIVGVVFYADPGSISASYNSVSMTQVGTLKQAATGNARIALFYLKAPATGTNTVSVTTGNSVNMWGASASYTGVDQTSPFDASNEDAPAGASSSADISVTTVANNCWIFLSTGSSAGRAHTSGTNTLIRTDVGASYSALDTNAAITPAGATTVGATTTSGNDNWVLQAMSFKPGVAASSAKWIGAGFFTFLLGLFLR